jgi:hypothetical protein
VAGFEFRGGLACKAENMAQAENGLGYTGTAKALHWIIVALLIVQFVLAWRCRVSGATSNPTP